jgi:hypothetical protein
MHPLVNVMFKTSDLKYYKTEINDESKETKCNYIGIFKIYNRNQKQFQTNI